MSDDKVKTDWKREAPPQPGLMLEVLQLFKRLDFRQKGDHSAPPEDPD